MKVALVHYSLRRGGGMESYLADLVRGFRAAGDSVDVWARDVDGDWARSLGANAYRLLPLPLPRAFRNRVFASRIARLELTERYPLVISLARTRGHHIAINGGTHPGFCAAMQRPDSAHDRRETRLERAMLDSAETVVAHSATLAAQIREFYPDTIDRLRVIYPPVDEQRFAPRDDRARAVARQALGLKADDIAFVFPSMDHARKGLGPLLDAFAQLDEPRARLLVAGRAARKELPPRVTPLGYVDDMPALYAAADWTVLPSRYEPFGLVIAESLACGTPAIVGREAGVAELMDADDGLKLDEISPSAILAALRLACAAPHRVAPGFVARHGLGLAAHIAALKQCRSAG
ncbi:glycosyltransferase family 4 protein [Nevskia ramosa]|uniref:glycosyltransferase family 4 protein n=1 Tax=Nevskia ramosa TaxID=64002 RepID=UPI003D0F4BD8